MLSLVCGRGRLFVSVVGGAAGVALRLALGGLLSAMCGRRHAPSLADASLCCSRGATRGSTRGSVVAARLRHGGLRGRRLGRRRLLGRWHRRWRRGGRLLVGRREVDDNMLGQIARLMALRMSYEDPIRIAQLQLAKFERAAGDPRAPSAEIMRLKFRIDEVPVPLDPDCDGRNAGALVRLWGREVPPSAENGLPPIDDGWAHSGRRMPPTAVFKTNNPARPTTSAEPKKTPNRLSISVRRIGVPTGLLAMSCRNHDTRTSKSWAPTEGILSFRLSARRTPSVSSQCQS